MSVKPRYEQIADQLRSEINEERFESGDKLPSEKRLCEYFNVSRITVRQALRSLEDEGLIFKKQGLGAFVSEDRSSQSLVHLTDFSEDMRRAGFSSSSKMIRFKKVNPILEINTILELPPKNPLMRLDRIRFAQKTPVAFDITWLPPSYGQLLMDEDLSQHTIYEILEDKYSIPIKAGMYKFTACSADKYIAEHLNVDEGSALLRIDRCSRSTGDKKVYFQKRYHNPKYISYDIELFRNDDSTESSRDGLPLKEFTPKFNVE
jgi:GntR family transcriptional regulator